MGWATKAAAAMLVFGLGWSAAGWPTAAPAPPAPFDAAACLPRDPSLRSLPGEWSARRKIVHSAVCEWSKFDYPVLVVAPPGAEDVEALPRGLGLDPALAAAAVRPRLWPAGLEASSERQVRFGLGEDDPQTYPHIRRYWGAVDSRYLNDIGAVTAYIARAFPAAGAAHRADLRPGWWRPWSAAFIAFTLQRGDQYWFVHNASHALYLASAEAARPGSVVAIEAWTPREGDLICMARPNGSAPPSHLLTSAGFLAQVRRRQAFASHCDVVVRINAGSVVSIGGNIKDGVTATVTPLKNGRLWRSTARPWAAALALADPADPCARIETVAVPAWRSPDLSALRRDAAAAAGCLGGV